MTDQTLPDDTTLGEAKEWLRERLDGGAKCPCCTQFAKVYKRTITSACAVALIKMYRAARLEWCYVPEVVGRPFDGDLGKLAFWGLVLESSEPRSDGGRRGTWRVTPDGERFIHGTLSLPKYAHIYDSRQVKPMFSGPLIGVEDALGDKFDLRELMSR